MKAYSFSFNTSDWLASPAVRLMSKAERGVYINLLALAWEAPLQGTLPASADKVRRMGEMSLEEWAESGEVILDKFPLSECGTYRYNPRLILEREKQEAKREINAEAGRRSAEKRAAEKASRETTAVPLQRNSNENPTPVVENPTPVENSSTISRVELSKEEGKPSTPLRSVTRAGKEPAHFSDFWQAYPRKESRATALKAFEKLTSVEQAAAPAAVRDWFARRADWIGADGTDYRPHPTTWLNQKRWTDLTEITILTPDTHGSSAQSPQRNAVNTQLVNDNKRSVAFAILAQLGS